jgi:acid stress-induced BolA-like protein IbaG/YrbA
MTPADMDPRDIAALIEQNLPGSKAEVHTDGQGHYEARVISPAFAGKRSLKRHQMVYGTLGSRVGREIHALALTTLTPEEAQAPSA